MITLSFALVSVGLLSDNDRVGTEDLEGKHSG